MSKIKVVCMSDLHGFLPPSSDNSWNLGQPPIPPCDLLLISGDICPIHHGYHGHSPAYQSGWLNKNMKQWLDQVPAKEVVVCAGNHDFVFQDSPDSVHKDLRWTYLQDDSCTKFGLKIFGSPWQNWFHDWAFNAPEPDAYGSRESEKFLEDKYDLIDMDTDIIISHGPPYKCGDKVDLLCCPEEDANVGSKALAKRIKKIQPKLVVTGHIHPGYGKYYIGDTVVWNASIVDSRYRPVNPIVVLEL